MAKGVVSQNYVYFRIKWFFHEQLIQNPMIFNDFFIFTNFNNFLWNSMIFPWSWNRSEFQWFFKTCGNPDLATGHQDWNNAGNRADPGDWSVAVSCWDKGFIPGALWSFFHVPFGPCSFSMKGMRTADQIRSTWVKWVHENFGQCHQLTMHDLWQLSITGQTKFF